MSSIHRLTIEKLVHGGNALARLNGRIVFVPGALPGEIVDVELPLTAGAGPVREAQPAAKEGRGPLEGILQRVFTAAPERREAPCPYFPRCGGCDWQHLEDTAQIEWKRLILAENFRRLGKIDYPAENIAIVAGRSLGYRSRIRLHRRGGAVGFFARGSEELVPIERCLVATDGINRLIREVAAVGEQSAADLTLLDGGDGLFRSDRDLIGALMIGEKRFSFATGSFSQSNRALLPALGAHLAGALRDGTLVDLYAGAGLLPFLIMSQGDKAEGGQTRAPRLRQVVCVEPEKDNALWIQRNLQSVAPDTPVTVITSTAERALPSLPLQKRLTLLLDPPRTGLSKEVRSWITRTGRNPRISTPDVIYVSCDAAALARDLGVLAPLYSIESVTVFDFYPQTAHIETVVVCRPRTTEER